MFQPFKPGGFIFKIYFARRLFISNNITGDKRITAIRTGVSSLIYNIIRKRYLRIVGSAINIL